jgi:hypothetical protein
MDNKPCKNCGSYGGNVGCDVCGPPIRERIAKERLALMACSPSSPLSADAPETNSLVRKAMTEPNVCIHRLAAKLTLKCEEMERERNTARRTAEMFRACAERTFGTMPFPRKFLWENETSAAAGGKKDANE